MSDRPLAAVVLAAGEGTRMRSKMRYGSNEKKYLEE
jgi:CTP:molybdopterin cytidylyltransferase MocA